MMPVVFQRFISRFQSFDICGVSRGSGVCFIHHLVCPELGPLDGPACVNFYDVVLDNQRKEIKGPGGWRADHLSLKVKSRTMARAGEALFFFYPRYRAAKMRAFSGNREKSAVFQPAEVELASYKGRDRTRGKLVHSAGLNDRIGLTGLPPGFPRSQIGQNKTCQFEKGQNSQADPEPVQETPSGDFGLLRFRFVSFLFHWVSVILKIANSYYSPSQKSAKDV
jgi:hypothetical protein